MKEFYIIYDNITREVLTRLTFIPIEKDKYKICDLNWKADSDPRYLTRELGFEWSIELIDDTARFHSIKSASTAAGVLKGMLTDRGLDYDLAIVKIKTQLVETCDGPGVIAGRVSNHIIKGIKGIIRPRSTAEATA
tara:strand:- start:6051 stop:6458 length:408 start_codon:yes stop_codon:yes gene_type:complete